MGKKRKKGKTSGSRRLARKLGVGLLVVIGLWGAVGVWFAHHPKSWIDAQPRPLSAALLYLGNPLGDVTDAFGLTGYDTVCEYDTEAPDGSVLFAGAPVRVSSPAPSDIRVLDRGEFLIGWSDRLRHPVWCAYHVKRAATHENAKRPGFTKDKSLANSPAPADYTKSGYDRGHMVPNYAIVTRYGEAAQKMTFLMSNVTPQSPALNRGVWREVEHRIADLWTARYGEIWVVVGCISPDANRETLSGTGIDVPTDYYQIVIAQEGMDVRALAVCFRQDVGWDAWPTRYLTTIRELEERTGLNFNPELPDFFARQLEGDLPTRLWPIRPLDIFKQIALRFM